jgi:PAS domain S-box-containing protein
MISSFELTSGLAAARRYGIALLCVAAAMVVRALLDQILDEARPFVTVFGGVALAVWLTRWRAAAVAAMVGYVATEYFFVIPQFQFRLGPMLNDFIGYALSCGAVIGVGEAMHRANDRAREEIEKRNQQQQRLAEQARLLDLSFDAIVVRDEEDRIIYWSRGAEHVYGYGSDEAVGRPIHELLRTQWREPLDGIKAELRRAGYWTGEATQTRKEGSLIVVMSRWVQDRNPRTGHTSILETNTDVTKHRLAEQQLHDNQQRLSLALQAAYLVSFEWDIQRDEVRRFVSGDAALPPTNEGPPGTFEAVRAIVHPDDRARFTANVEAAMADDLGRYENQFRFTRASGEVAWMMERGMVQRDSKGRPARLIGLSQDITASKLAEERLRASEERLREVLENSLDAAYRRDLSTDRYDFVSPRFELVVDISADRLRSMPFTAVFERIHPDDRERVRTGVEAGMTSNRGRIDYRFRGDDGQYRWLADHFTIQRDEAGAPRYLSGSIRNITEQKRTEQALRDSEARFRGVFENAAAGVCMMGIDGRFIRVNDTFARMVGYPQHELYALTFGDITLPDDAHTDWEQARRVFAGEISSYTMEKRYVRKDGGVIWVTLSASAQRDPAGQLQYGIAVVSDITDQKEAEAALSRAHEQLAAHARELDALVERRTAELRDVAQQLETFSYSIVHDLRAPLRSMQSFASLLEEDQGARLTESGRDYLRRIIRAAGRMDGLITEVLAYSRVARRDAPVGAVDLDQLVSEMIEAYPQFQDHAAAIRIERPLAVVRGNPALLTQVLSNLIGNALKFVPPGRPPRVTLRSERSGGRVRVWVQDQGIGIPPEHQQKLFGVFQRLHTSSEYPGTGLGLATVKKAIERMDGAVGLESDYGVGTRFWFELPAAESTARPELPWAAEATKPTDHPITPDK